MNVVVPGDLDVAVTEQLAHGLDPDALHDKVAGELIAEIVSPSDRWQDMRAKLDDYFSIGVQQVWVVEPDTHSVLVYRSPTEAAKLGKADTLQGEGVLQGFSLPVARVFAD